MTGYTLPRIIPTRDDPRPFAERANAIEHRHPPRLEQTRRWWMWWRV